MEASKPLVNNLTFCTSSTVPAQTLCYPNNKPWATNDIKDLLNNKGMFFRVRNKVELRMGLLSGKIRETKNNNRRKLEQKLQQNSREVWSVIKDSNHPIEEKLLGDRASDLNLFFN